MGPVDREVTAGSAPHQGEAKVGRRPRHSGQEAGG